MRPGGSQKCQNVNFWQECLANDRTLAAGHQGSFPVSVFQQASPRALWARCLWSQTHYPCHLSEMISAMRLGQALLLYVDWCSKINCKNFKTQCWFTVKMVMVYLNITGSKPSHCAGHFIQNENKVSLFSLYKHTSCALKFSQGAFKYGTRKLV